MTETQTAKHTPGPWVVYHGPREMNTGLNPFFKGTVAILSDDITVILDRDAPAFDYEANARLIAAAPDLLEALEAIQQYLERRPLTPEVASLSLKVLTAIAKATGGAS